MGGFGSIDKIKFSLNHRRLWTRVAIYKKSDFIINLDVD